MPSHGGVAIFLAMVALATVSEDDPTLREMAATYCGALLAVTPQNIDRQHYMRALKLALVTVSQEAIADGTSTREAEAVYYESVAARIRLTAG